MLPTPSPRATPPQRRVNKANVIKWMQALPASQRVSDLPGRPDRAAPRRKTAPCAHPAPVHPLPDPALARLCAVPESAPPYDDDPGGEAGPPIRLAAGRAAAVNGPGTQSAGPPKPDGRGKQARPAKPGAAAKPAGPAKPVGPAKPAGPVRPAAPAGRAGTRKPSGTQTPGEAAPPAGNEPDGTPPRATPPWPNQFAQILAETLAGARSSHQLTPWTTERARGHIRRLGPFLSASQQPRIRRVVTSTPADGIVELTVVVNFGPRVRALAVRLERAERGATGRSWLCTAIEAA